MVVWGRENFCKNLFFKPLKNPSSTRSQSNYVEIELSASC